MVAQDVEEEKDKFEIERSIQSVQNSEIHSKLYLIKVILFFEYAKRTE